MHARVYYVSAMRVCVRVRMSLPEFLGRVPFHDGGISTKPVPPIARRVATPVGACVTRVLLASAAVWEREMMRRPTCSMGRCCTCSCTVGCHTDSR